MSFTPAPAISQHWDKCALYLNHAFTLFGGPADIAQRIWLHRREHRLFSRYIRPLEALVRRLIFIMALELAPMILPPKPERKTDPRLGMPVNTGAHFEITEPETWRVSLRLSAFRSAGAPAGIDPSPATHAGEGAGAPFTSSRISSAASAERLEALIRAYANPDKYAAALARKLARDAAAAAPFLKPAPKKLTHKPLWITLAELAPRIEDAFLRWLPQQRVARALNTS